MSTEGLEAFVIAVYAVRWVLVVLGFIALGGLVAGANARADRWRARAVKAEAELRSPARRRPIVALKPKSEARHG